MWNRILKISTWATLTVSSLFFITHLTLFLVALKYTTLGLGQVPLWPLANYGLGIIISLFSMAKVKDIEELTAQLQARQDHHAATTDVYGHRPKN